LADDSERAVTIRRNSLWAAYTPVIMLVVLIVLAFFLYGDEATGGPVQVALLFIAILSGWIGIRHGHKPKDIFQGAIDSVTTAIGAIFILLAIGALIGTWNMSGTIATLTDYGIRFISPTFFYIAVVGVTALIALSIGSSWTVVGTLGAALVGIGIALGLSAEITAGAVISGAYFGDKLSPLSETTNLTPAVSGTDLYTHIKLMTRRTIPSITVASVIFFFIGLRAQPEGGFDLTEATDAIEEAFNIGLIMLLPLLVVILLAIKKVQPSVTILLGALTAGIIAVIFQADVVLAFVNEPDLPDALALFKGVWSAMATGFVADTGFPGLDDLLSGGGMESMLNTVWLILSALAFGGVMAVTGQLGRIIEPLRERAKSDSGILVATGVTAIGINLVAADQYLAIVLTGTSFREEYEERGLAPEMLSTTIEGTATVSSPLIPWNSCGAYMSASLGVATFAYLPYAFFNLIDITFTFLFAILKINIKHVTPDEELPPAPEQVRLYGIDKDIAPIEEVGQITKRRK
jgi:NhaC family Na+:H+ antiporter